MCLNIEQTGLYTYPDLSIVCGAIELSADRPDPIINLCVLIEVLAPRTEHDDRGGEI